MVNTLKNHRNRQFFVGTLGFLLIGLCVFFQTGCKKESPTESDDTSKGVFVDKIAFVQADQKSYPKIYVADVYNQDGTFTLSDKKYLRDGRSPSMSSDRTWMTYIFVDGNNNAILRKMKTDGTMDEEIPVSPSGMRIQSAPISPDNKLIAVYVGDINGLQIGVIPATGGTYTWLFGESHGRSQLPEWSIDSKKVYFTYVDFGNRIGHNVPPLAKAYIASINIDGSNLTFVSDTANGLSDDIYHEISPDGQSIVFTSLRSHPGEIIPEVFIMDREGHNIRRLTESLISEKHMNGPHGEYYDYITNDYSPHWLKDNQHIVFTRETNSYTVSNDSFSYISDIYILDRINGQTQNLTNNGITSLSKK
jgi:Tol biopolymer transport system component